MTTNFQKDFDGWNQKKIVKKFNRELFLGIPMSTKLKDNKYYIPVSVKKRVYW